MNELVLGLTILSAILACVVYVFEIRKRGKYPIATIFGAFFLTGVIVLFLTSKKSDSENDEINKKTAGDTLAIKKIDIDSLQRVVADSVKRKIEDSLDPVVTFKIFRGENFYYTDFGDYDRIYFRSRALTKKEIDICNQCMSYTKGYSSETKILVNDVTYYEDLSKSVCQEKEKLDRETGLGYILTGTAVELIGRQEKFVHIKILNNSAHGWIAARVQGKETLTKASKTLFIKEGEENDK